MRLSICRRTIPALLAMGALLSAACGSSGSGTAELPRVPVERADDPPSGPPAPVPEGSDFQAALDAAQPGDVIELEAGLQYTGPFTLPAKAGSDWITIRSDAPESSLPPAGARIDPGYSNALPKLVSSSGPVLRADPGAHHYHFIGIEFRPAAGAFLHNLVLLGDDESAVDELPHHIVFDRCYFHGDRQVGARRGIALNSRHTAVLNSYFSDFKEVGADSQAIAGWNGPGPFEISNNYLEGAGENVLFGGADPSIANLVPSDIEIRGNHFAKQLSWRIGHPTYEGRPWTVKNLFELKNARRVLIDGNLFEYNWPHAQNGFAILFTVRNQEGSAPWSVVEDVTFTNNVVRHSGSGINILGRDNTAPSGRTQRLLIKSNLFEDVGGEWGTGILFQLLDDTANVVIEHNTAFQTGSIVVADGRPHAGFVFVQNIVPHNAYGIIGTGTGIGEDTLAAYFPGAVVLGNLIVGGSAALYPPGNHFPASFAEVGFVDLAGGDYRLADTSPFKDIVVEVPPPLPPPLPDPPDLPVADPPDLPPPNLSLPDPGADVPALCEVVALLDCD